MKQKEDKCLWALRGHGKVNTAGGCACDENCHGFDRLALLEPCLPHTQTREEEGFYDPIAPFYS